ncbi:hypothetical protein K8354_06110 [Polaribacter litorisediminis]|uniref:hypothetical protein n=1 Tax=Polaribacter litorisediminis TaxID=1908341 RepID=UPI001CC03D38|nr:hypothetical protein [Polaribacter litorisediminis]UAM99385.1 hypothetical protein K8354_06110 [Polaribacter litorisediminis]
MEDNKSLNEEQKETKKEIKKNAVGEDSNTTKETKKVDNTDSEILKGKSLEKVKEVKESFNSLEQKLLNKLL